MACGMANVQSKFFMTAKPQLATKPLSQYRAELSNFFFCWKSHILGKIFRPSSRNSLVSEMNRWLFPANPTWHVGKSPWSNHNLWGSKKWKLSSPPPARVCLPCTEGPVIRHSKCWDHGGSLDWGKGNVAGNTCGCHWIYKTKASSTFSSFSFSPFSPFWDWLNQIWVSDHPSIMILLTSCINHRPSQPATSGPAVSTAPRSHVSGRPCPPHAGFECNLLPDVSSPPQQKVMAPTSPQVIARVQHQKSSQNSRFGHHFEACS